MAAAAAAVAVAAVAVRLWKRQRRETHVSKRNR